MTGADTLTGELMALVGFTNVGGALAGKTGGFVPLERLVAEPPQLLIVGASAGHAEDQGSALLAHPALLELYPAGEAHRAAREADGLRRSVAAGGPRLADAREAARIR